MIPNIVLHLLGASVLGEHCRHKGSGNKRRCVLVEDIMMYVPILETLQVLLQNEAIVAEV